MSRKIRSGDRLFMALTASRPLPHSSTISIWGSFSRSKRRLRRASGSSSTIIVLILSAIRKRLSADFADYADSRSINWVAAFEEIDEKCVFSWPSNLLIKRFVSSKDPQWCNDHHLHASLLSVVNI